MTDIRSGERVAGQPAFVLHTYPWRETSLIVEALTRDYGRLALVAKGAKRPMSQYRGMLNCFCPLMISFYGKNEIKTLTRCEWHGALPLEDKVLLSAFYINELIVRLVARGDPVPKVFDCYYKTLKKLASGANHYIELRYFEVEFLQLLGYGMNAHSYEAPYYRFSRGELIQADSFEEAFRSSTIRALLNGTLEPGEQEQEARRMTREFIEYYLEQKPMNTRRIINELQKLKS